MVREEVERAARVAAESGVAGSMGDRHGTGEVVSGEVVSGSGVEEVIGKEECRIGERKTAPPWFE